MLVEQHRTSSRYIYVSRCLHNNLKVLCLQLSLTFSTTHISFLAPLTILLKVHITKITNRFRIVIKTFFKRLNLYFRRDCFPSFYKMDF